MESVIKIETNKKSLRDLVEEYPVLAKYLESSKKFYEQNEIPLSSAEYDEENR